MSESLIIYILLFLLVILAAVVVVMATQGRTAARAALDLQQSSKRNTAPCSATCTTG